MPLQATTVGEEDLLEEPEPDRESKQIAELQRRLTVLERVHPVLRVEAQDAVGARIERLDAETRVFLPLSEEALTDPMLGLRNEYGPEFRDFLPRLPPHRDPNEFYWKYRHPTEWACSCDEFRHHGDAEVFELTLAGSRTGAINYRVTASNMPEVVRGTIPVRFTGVEVDTAPVAREIIRSSAALPE